MRFKKMLVATVGAGLVLGGTLGAWAGVTEPPGPPPWVNSDGTVDLSKLPATLPLLDEDGEVVGHVDPRTYFNDEADGVIEGESTFNDAGAGSE